MQMAAEPWWSMCCCMKEVVASVSKVKLMLEEMYALPPAV